MLTHTYATFTDPDMAEKAAGALLDYGIESEHLSIVFPAGHGSKKSRIVEGEKVVHDATFGISTTTAADANVGAAKGAGIGALAGVLTAIVAITVPGIGLVIGGGALAIALGGVAATTAAGAVAGGVTGFLKDQGVNHDSILRFDEVLRKGGAMISVTTTGEDVKSSEVESILAKYGGMIPLAPVRPLNPITETVLIPTVLPVGSPVVVKEVVTTTTIL